MTANPNEFVIGIQVNPDGTFELGDLETLAGNPPKCSKEQHGVIDDLTEALGFSSEDNEAARRTFTAPIANQQSTTKKNQIRR